MSLPNAILLDRRRPTVPFRAGESIRLHAFPDVEVRVSDVLR